jgi:hypothetical protein
MSSIIAQLAGDEGATVKLVMVAQHADATPMLVLESMSCLWAIMFVNKASVTRVKLRSAFHTLVAVCRVVSLHSDACYHTQHVRDGAVAMGDIPALLSHVRTHWKEGYGESAAIIGVCKAVDMVASGVLVSLREAGAIAEGLDVRARGKTPMIKARFDNEQLGEDEQDYEGFQAAAEIVAERQQMEYLGLSPDHQSPNAHGSSARGSKTALSPTNNVVTGMSSPVGNVRR